MTCSKRSQTFSACNLPPAPAFFNFGLVFWFFLMIVWEGYISEESFIQENLSEIQDENLEKGDMVYLGRDCSFEVVFFFFSSSSNCW